MQKKNPLYIKKTKGMQLLDYPPVHKTVLTTNDTKSDHNSLTPATDNTKMRL